MKGVKKQHLPAKPCATCGRPFAWRKKWERVWDEFAPLQSRVDSNP